jgi:hypothetical protein
VLYETNAFATLFKNVDARYFDALMHASWRVLINRTMHILADHAPEARFLRPDTAPTHRAQRTLRMHLGELRRHAVALGPAGAIAGSLRLLGELLERHRREKPGPRADVRHPHAVAQLEAVARVLSGMDRLHEKRSQVQGLRVRSDLEIWREFPPWIVDTYPGDRALFASPGFRALLPPDIPFRYASVGEIHDGTAPVGDHPDP